MTKCLIIIISFLMTKTFGQTSKVDTLKNICTKQWDTQLPRNKSKTQPQGIYVQTSGLYRFEIKIKGSGQKGKAVFTKRHFETRTTKYHGNWYLNQDTLNIVYKNNCIAAHKFLLNDSCLLNIDKKNCVYKKNK